MSNERRKPYPFDQFESKWQGIWEKERTFHASNPGEKGFDPAKPKFYVLDMFPYPSGTGLHVGHPEGYTATDIVARYKRLRGFNVLHPMGWDAFGLPAEQYAIRTGQHPALTTRENIAKFRSQLQAIGFSYDWEREINTTDPKYYKWTQWIFLQIYNSWFNPVTQKAEPISTYRGSDPDVVRLAYVASVPVNWCPELGTVLANEEVVDGKSEVGGFPVVKRPMRQWMLRITAYADRLMSELDGLDWPESIKLLQRNWIGRSEGAEVAFEIAGREGGAESPGPLSSSTPAIAVFTTRPDTIYGATYMVLAPENPLVDQLTTDERRNSVAEYRATIAAKSDLERTELAKDKTGVFIGAFAINPASNEKLPIWTADYVLMGYGTGAVMGVPGHDERDLEFARKFDLPILAVVHAPGKTPEESIGFIADGVAINSPVIDGLLTPEAKKRIIAWLAERGRGQGAITYKLRDWLFSRQRYWGEPFPVIWEDGRHRSLDENELPVVPPPLEDYKPSGTGEPPLAKAPDWVRYSETATRELNVMPQWAGSCWYYLRFCDPGNAGRFVGEEAERYWMGGGTGFQPVNHRQDADGTNLLQFNPNERIQIRSGAYLPHWTQEGATYAVTFRLADSLPEEILRQIRTEKAELERLSSQYESELGDSAKKRLETISSEKVEAFLDAGHGKCWLQDERVARIVVDAFRHFHGIRYDLLAWCIMPNHVHVIVRPKAGYELSKILHSWKSFSATEANKILQREGAFWQPETYDHLIRSQIEFDRQVRYVVENPERVGLSGRKWVGGGTGFQPVNHRQDADATGTPGGVDLYVGGTEHAVLHLLYARFWHKVLFDLGFLSKPEPFQRLVNQGIILGEDGQKMSKSRGNVVNPDDVITLYGADAFRCYEMFMGPLEHSKPWSMHGVEGVARFLARVWRLVMVENQAGEWEVAATVGQAELTKPQQKILHATIKKVTEDIESLSFNTAISQMMIFVNAFTNAELVPVGAIQPFLVLLNPFAPHLSSELWQSLALPGEITGQSWPEFDGRFLIEDEIEIVVQLNGKVRDHLTVPVNATDDEIKTLALKSARIQELVGDKQVKKVVVVPKKLVNVVVA